MLSHRHIDKIIIVVMAVLVCACLLLAAFRERLASPSEDKGIKKEYETALFNHDEIMEVDIIMPDKDWEELLNTAMKEEYRECEVVVNGVPFYHVGIRPKGNTSLMFIAGDPDTDRYSFKLEFDHYVEGQTCFGLDKLILNNNYADATNRKEALIYDMYQYLDADASLYNYAKISVNGEYFGLYLALEAVEDSFLERNYGTDIGKLYKPEPQEMGGGEDGGFKEGPGGMPGDFDFDNFDYDKFDKNRKQPGGQGRPGNADGPMGDKKLGNFGFGGADIPSPPDMQGGGTGFGGPDFNRKGNGSNLNYTDDNLESYSVIWEGAVNSSSPKDHKRVVKALKNISEGNELEKYMDIDNLLKYMAVHVFAVNDDSLTGNMAHNYYLYEKNGALNLIPWDYNLSFGGMGGMGGFGGSTNATSDMVNDEVYHAFTGTKFFDTLMENEEYRGRYYEYLRILSEEYVLGGGFDAFYERTRKQIDSLVEADPTAFYTNEEYGKALDTFYPIVKLRAQSVMNQVTGPISAGSEGKKKEDYYVDTGDLDISVLGTMMQDGKEQDGFVPKDGMPRGFDFKGRK